MNELYQRAWPVQDAKAAVVIVHGIGEHSGRYDYVARSLNGAGYAAHALDMRGHGQSPGFPGDMGQDFSQLVADLEGFCIRVAEQYPKTFLLGHSAGATVCLAAVPELPMGTIDGLVVSAVPIVPGPATLEALSDPSGFKVPTDALSRDPEVVTAYEQDPLVIHDPIPMDKLAPLLEGSQRATESIGQITIPVLAVYGLADRVADPMGANQLYTQLITTDKTVKAYEELYHEVLNEPERDKVIADIVAWLDERSG